MAAQVNEQLVRDVVSEVLGRLGHKAPAPAPQPDPSPISPAPRRTAGRHGVFEDPAAACDAAHAAFLRLQEKGVDGRRRVIDILKRLAVGNAREWARIELEETKIGRLDHKIEKMEIQRLVPGVEFLHPTGFSGDHGITLEEYCPFGVIAAVTPSTHSIPTVTANAINMIAAGNAVVFNTHPGATACARTAVMAYNEAIERQVGIRDLLCMVAAPTVDSFQAICTHEHTKLICVTGGPAVVRAAMKTGRRAICAGPGNPPVLVCEDADIDQAARDIIAGGGYDNNLLCIGEKMIFVVDRVADALKDALRRHGAVELNAPQIDRLTQAAFNVKPGEAVGCPHAVVNKDLIGRDAAILARHAGAQVPDGTPILFGETPAQHVFVQEEQMMPFLPLVRVRNVGEGIAAAKQAEHGYGHTAIIHTHNVAYMTTMAREMNTTLFIKNGPCMAGLGLDGEGYLSFTVATPTGEGVTNPRTFTRVRRCVMKDKLRIY